MTDRDIAGQGFSTRAIHAGYEPDPQTGAVNVPIYASSTFAQDGVGGLRGGFEYARTGNPTRACAGGQPGGARGRTRTGAPSPRGWPPPTARCARCCGPGDHLVIPDDAYGGTFRLIDKVFAPVGHRATPVAAVTDLDAVRAAITPQTKLVWVETPTNPLLNIADIEAIAAVAHDGWRKAGGGQHLRLARTCSSR